MSSLSKTHQKFCPHSKFNKFLAEDGPKYTQNNDFCTKMWSKTHIWTNLRFLCEIDQKVTIFDEKLKKNATSKNDL